MSGLPAMTAASEMRYLVVGWSVQSRRRSYSSIMSSIVVDVTCSGWAR